MADVGVFCKNANIQARCPSSVSATAKAIAATDIYILDVENIVNVMTKYDWSSAYASLSASVKYMLMDTAACLAAMYVINADTTGFQNQADAQTSLNFLRDRFMQNIDILKEIKVQEFIT